MYEQILINALETISRQPNFIPAFDDLLGQNPFTVERASKIAKDALHEYKKLISQEKETSHGQR